MTTKTQSKLVIHGGKPLHGRVEIVGAKNAALKELAATLLTSEPVSLSNLPNLRDITLMLELLADLGAELTLQDQHTMMVQCQRLTSPVVPYELVRAMRASVVLLGPLLAAHGAAEVALPGGCAIGSRPVDIHLQGLRAMGAQIDINGGFIHAKVKGRLKGADIQMHTRTVTGTENLMMAATLAKGTTILRNAAQEPEVVDLAVLLNKMGAKIQGAGNETITIEGVEALHGATHTVIADRIEAGTYLIAAAITGGNVTVGPVDVPSMQNILDLLTRAGAQIHIEGHDINLSMQSHLLQPVNVTTAPYPGVPTDMQAQLMTLNALAGGASEICENIFENRFMHIPELNRLGANIHHKGQVATIMGVAKFSGAPVVAHDLRAAASLVLAGLAAEGTTEVEAIHHLDRGYAFIEEKLSRLGADIQRVSL